MRAAACAACPQTLLPSRLFLLSRSPQIGASRVHQGPARNPRSPEQHSKAHIVPARQRDLYTPFLAADPNRRHYDVPHFPMTPGIGHVTPVGNRRFADDLDGAVALPRMHAKPNPRRAASIEAIDLEGVQGGGPSARVYLGFDAADGKLGKSRPFSPSQNQRTALVRIHCRSYPSARPAADSGWTSYGTIRTRPDESKPARRAAAAARSAGVAALPMRAHCSARRPHRLRGLSDGRRRRLASRYPGPTTALAATRKVRAVADHGSIASLSH